MPRKKESTFEENLAALEKLVNELESGDANLGDIMKNYTSGIELSQKCLAELKRAEKEIDTMITSTNGKVEESELEIERN